eukprot:gb/GECH01014899.1/.p1 GENE.gb/GECH01014899.1/~~gb/GECH01014899.1/.p1  ORF type:complete len:289 (+),score=44.40 gb/GECH01014899.1/:1-867(+)
MECNEVQRNNTYYAQIILQGTIAFSVLLRIHLLYTRKLLKRHFHSYRKLSEEKQKICLFNFTKSAAEAFFLIPMMYAAYTITFHSHLTPVAMTFMSLSCGYFSATYLNELVSREASSTMSWVHHIGYWIMCIYTTTIYLHDRHDCVFTGATSWPLLWLSTLSFLDFVLGLYNAGVNRALVSKLLYVVVIFEIFTKAFQAVMLVYYFYQFWNEFEFVSRTALICANIVWVPADMYLPIAFHALYKKCYQEAYKDKKDDRIDDDEFKITEEDSETSTTTSSSTSALRKRK